MAQHHYDYIIVGQGLAGSILAHELAHLGQKICIIDNHHHKASSTVAAGIINPLTGPRLNLTEDFFKLYTHALNFYEKIEKDHACTVFYPLKQVRWLNHQKIAHYYKKKLKKYPQLFTNKTPLDPFEQSDPTVNIQYTASVDVKKLLNTLRKYFEKHHDYLFEHFNYDALQIKQNNQLIYKHISAQYIVFCEGHQNIYNPFFDHSLFRLSSGSVLNLESPQLEKKLYNWGHWLCPDFYHPGTFNLGASYHWDLDCASKLQHDKKLFLKTLQYILNPRDISIIHHQWGVRPSTKDRKPIIQSSEHHPHVLMFNGFGSKGCLSIPYYVQQFCTAQQTKIHSLNINQCAL